MMNEQRAAAERGRGREKRKRRTIGKEKVGETFFVKKTNACQAITIEQRQQNLQSLLSEGSFAQEVVTTSN